MAPINPIDDMPPPPAPEDPPTDADVACARKYVDDVATRYRTDALSLQIQHIYALQISTTTFPIKSSLKLRSITSLSLWHTQEVRLVNAASGNRLNSYISAPAAPEWFNAALTTALRPLQNSVNQMRREMRQEFGEVHRKLYTISRSVIQVRLLFRPSLREPHRMFLVDRLGTRLVETVSPCRMLRCRS